MHCDLQVRGDKRVAKFVAIDMMCNTNFVGIKKWVKGDQERVMTKKVRTKLTATPTHKHKRLHEKKH